MTKNQLEYWKLRWTQHYESIYLKIQKQKADEEERANKARELETKRHNQAQERIQTQQNILTKQKLDQDWAKMTVEVRSMYVHDVVSTAKTLAEVDQLMSKMKTMEMETLLAIAQANDKSSIDYAKAAVDAYDKAIKLEGEAKLGGGKSPISVTTEIKGSGAAMVVQQLFNNSVQSGLAATKIRENIVKIWPEYVELLGPQAEKYVSNKVSKTIQEIKADYLTDQAYRMGYVKKGGEGSGQSSNSNKSDYSWNKSSAEYIDAAKKIVGPSYDSIKSVNPYDKTNGVSTSSGITIVNGGASRSSNQGGPGVSSNSSGQSTSGTKIIYSPGVSSNRNSGPGVR